MREQVAKLFLILMAGSLAVHTGFAADSVTLKIITEPGSKAAEMDPLTLNAGTIYQGLAALGFTAGSTHQNRSTTDNRAIPATLVSMTTAAWPLLPGLTSKGLVAEGKSSYYYPNIQEPDIEKPQRHANALHATGRLPTGTTAQYAERATFATSAKVEKPQFEVPNHIRAQYDYTGPPFSYTLSAEMMKNPLIANDPNVLRLFIKTNGTGARDTLRSLDAATHVRRIRSASFWDGVEAPNNPRADYQNGKDYEAKARNASRALLDIRDPAQPVGGATDPRPGYETRPYFNPVRNNIFLRR